MNRKKTILIIDEEIRTRTLLGIMLESGGRFQPLKTHNAETALNSLKKTRPGMIILDMDGHTMNGIELCHTLRQQPETSTIPILMLSSKSDADSVQHGMEAGASDYMTKPVLHHDLIDKVQALLATTIAKY